MFRKTYHLPPAVRYGVVRRDDTSIEPGHPPGASLFYPFSGLMFALSASATIYFCRSMEGGMNMPGGWTMSMMWMRMPGQSWFLSGAMFLLMWLTMMVAMMLPSALPMLLRFRRVYSLNVARQAAMSTLLVACGYFAAWIAIGIVVYMVGVIWALATMRWAGFSSAMPTLTGAALVLAGIYQFSPWKEFGLHNCRNALACSSPDVQAGPLDALVDGFRQGKCCVICCSGLMLALLVLGAMNLLVMLGIAAVIASEKLLPKPQVAVQLSGILAMVAGAVTVVASLV